MTTVEALKELFTALGGSAEDVENIVTNPEMVHAIAEIAGNIGGLPEVSAEDNGDLLSVVNGEWDKKKPDTEQIVIYAEETTVNNRITWGNGIKSSDIYKIIKDSAKPVYIVGVTNSQTNARHIYVMTELFSTASFIRSKRESNYTTYYSFNISDNDTEYVTVTPKVVNDPA